MPNVRRLFRYVRPYWRQMVAATLALLASSLIALALPWAVSLLVDSVFASSNTQLLNPLALAVLALFVVQSFLYFLEAYYLERTGQRVVGDSRLDLHERLLSLPIAFRDNRCVGETTLPLQIHSSGVTGVQREISML